jgi:hypothetical protein
LALTTGSQNTAFGSSALLNVSTTSRNIGVGQDAGRRIGSGGVNQTPVDSIFIGVDCRASVAGGVNEIVIGRSASGNGSNTVTLGNTSIVKTFLRGTINAGNLPTSATGLVAGDIWNDAGTLKIV